MDGSLAMPSRNKGMEAPNSLLAEDETNIASSHLLKERTISNENSIKLPVIIGSAGCASDCESLKRRVRLELDALEFNFHPSTTSLGVQSIANLLQQVLYGRRGFPFYSFCVVAGIDYCDSDGSGAVYVYDAIGSFERVAVGCSGTGRELLQPILDRLFSDSSRGIKEKRFECLSLGAAHNSDVMSIPAVEQRHGVAGRLRPPVRTTVDCTWEEAVRNIARGFQAVSEREISVGDELVICLLRSKEGKSTADVINFKLKKH
jgi:20S proteasome subunit beta 6